ncbi:hypothetical protein GCM10010094_83540 [Streptomyces flaveus]|uniref:Uncharacterized protein n=1 Tax=Streptomyces flaveus TaxID=66370 RepID=A0A917RIE9_9ACTN|nr:hypothetical protein [Streptomyces flaveus]GGL09970.1 hypothetical protein GCM10010094_83540 [Streptomyces flaveus]
MGFKPSLPWVLVAERPMSVVGLLMVVTDTDGRLLFYNPTEGGATPLIGDGE